MTQEQINTISLCDAIQKDDARKAIALLNAPVTNVNLMVQAPPDIFNNFSFKEIHEKAPTANITPLMLCCLIYDREHYFPYLFEKGADMLVKSSTGHSALMYAIRRFEVSPTNLLLNGYKTFLEKQGLSNEHIKEKMKEIVDQKSDNRTPVICNAILQGSFKIETLKKFGATMNATDRFGRDILLRLIHFLNISDKYFQSLGPQVPHIKQCLRMSITHLINLNYIPANVNILFEDGSSPLTQSFTLNLPELQKFLMQHNASPALGKDILGNTPLILACKLLYGAFSMALIEEMLRRGADGFVTNVYGQSAAFLRPDLHAPMSLSRDTCAWKTKEGQEHLPILDEQKSGKVAALLQGMTSYEDGKKRLIDAEFTEGEALRSLSNLGFGEMDASKQPTLIQSLQSFAPFGMSPLFASPAPCLMNRGTNLRSTVKTFSNTFLSLASPSRADLPQTQRPNPRKRLFTEEPTVS